MVKKSALLVFLSALVLSTNCVPSQPVEMYTQQQQMLVAQPQVYVARPQPVVVQRPVVVYRPQPQVVVQPSPVLNPVRVSVPGHLYAQRICVPGSARQCEAYCGGGLQYCAGDGRSWGSCIEQNVYW